MNAYDVTNAPLVHVGDSITFSSAVTEYFSMTQMQQITNFVDVSTATSHTYNIAPNLLTTANMSQEMYEATLISLQGAVVTAIRHRMVRLLLRMFQMYRLLPI